MQVIELDSSIIRESYIYNKVSKSFIPYQFLKIVFNFEGKSFKEYFVLFRGCSDYDDQKKSSELLGYRNAFISETESGLDVQLFFGLNDKDYTVVFKLIANPNYNERSSKSPNYVLRSFEKTLKERLEEIPEYQKVANEIGKRDQSLQEVKRSRGK